MEFKPFVKIRKEKFGAIIFDTLREKVFVTNETGAEILQLLEDRSTREKIPLILTERFKGDSAPIAQDVASFIEELAEKDLVIK